MATNLSFRPPTMDDVAEMLAIHVAAFDSSAINQRCFPPSDPKWKADFGLWIQAKLSQITVACDAEGQILGWVRWVRWPRREARDPRPVLTPDMYAPTGDPELATKFFQTNIDSLEEIMDDDEFWFLSMLVVKPEAQRKGVGSALMKPWVEKADEEGLECYLNGSTNGRRIYEKFGFRVSRHSQFKPDLETFHMRREAKAKETK